MLLRESVELLKEMISVPSLSFEEDEVCSLVCRHLRDKGINAERIGNNLIARNEKWKEGKKTLMMCAHMDTVPPADDYDFDPYLPDYDICREVIGKSLGYKPGKEDIVCGLGSNDDGASAVSMIAAFRHFNGEDLPFNLLLVLNAEEERSGPDGMSLLWKKHVEADMAIVGEPTGMNAASSERGLIVVDATASGVSGHAARKEGVNALYKAVDDICRLKSYRFDRISPLMGEVNMNVTQINAGTAHNVIPDKCSFVIDIRPTDAYENSEIMDILGSICRSELVPRNMKNKSSASYADSPLLKAVLNCGFQTFSSPTTSDWMRIDCDAVKIGPGESSRSHRKNEFVLVEEIRKGIEGYIRLIGELADYNKYFTGN